MPDTLTHYFLAVIYIMLRLVKELNVPMSKMDDLKKFYRIIASDERNTAVLKPTVH